MNEVIFLAGFVVTVPLGIVMASSSRKMRDLVLILLIIGTTNTAQLFEIPLDINFLSREFYRGTTRGIEISYMDFLSLILLVSSMIVRQREGQRIFWPATFTTMLVYLCYSFCVFAITEPKLFQLFELSKIMRGFILFLAVAYYVRGRREVQVLLWALCATMGYETLICFRDRYIYHFHRIKGTLGHPNSLSMYCLLLLPMFATTFFSNAPALLRRTAAVCTLLSIAGVLLSISRTGFLAVLIILALIAILCVGISFSPKNILILFIGFILVCAMVAKAWDSVIDRLGMVSITHEYSADVEGNRGSYFRLAEPAIRDNFFGVGINNWSYAITNEYGMMSGQEFVPYFGTSDIRPENSQALVEDQSIAAHNLWVLTVTELGWIGLIIFSVLWMQRLFHTGKAILARSPDLLCRFRMGVFLSMCGILMQSWTEFAYRQTSLYFVVHILMGAAISVALIQPIQSVATAKIMIHSMANGTMTKRGTRSIRG